MLELTGDRVSARVHVQGSAKFKVSGTFFRSESSPAFSFPHLHPTPLHHSNFYFDRPPLLLI